MPKRTYPCDMRRFRHRKVRFNPSGDVYSFGDHARHRMRENKAERQDVIPLTARLFVGLSVGEKSTYTVDDVARITKRVRTEQGELPDASFLIQRGIYTDNENRVIDEDSVQVIIFSFSGDAEEFEKQMVELAEVLIDELQQETIYVEMQRGGIPYSVFKVTQD
jgi:hypothetical protein